MKNRIQYHMKRIGDDYNFFFKTISPPRPSYMNNKGQKRTSCQLIKIKDGFGVHYYCNKKYDKTGKVIYYTKMYVEISTCKTKRRIANKIARKQRKINRKK